MKKVDVLFVHPNGAPFVYQDLSNKYSAIEPPIWAALLANHTRIKGHSTAILDCEAERYDVASSAHAILQYDAKLVAIVVYGQQPSASTQNMHAASLLCNKLQEEKIESKVMLLGLHPSAVSRQTLTRESVDFVCQGEGMYTITSLLGLDMNKTSDLEKVPGLWYRDNDRIKFTKPAPIVDQKDLETEVKILNLDKESEYARLEKQRNVDVKRAQEKATIIKEQSERQKDSEEAQIISEQQIKNAKIEQQKNIDTHRIESERVVRLLDIEKAKRLSIEEHQKNLEIINKSKQVLKSKAEEENTRGKAIEAEERANSARYVEKAQGIKKVDVISAASKAEQERHSTMAAKLRYEIDAAGKEALNSAENLRSDASRRSALRLKLADKIESIIRESVKPMANINYIKIIDVNGLPGFSGTSEGSSGGGTSEKVSTKDGSKGGNLADNVVSSALRYRAHQPFLDGLLKEIGMAPGEVSNIRNILGDYENPKKDFHMNFEKDPTKGSKDSK